MSMEYIVLSLRIVAVTEMTDADVVEGKLLQLILLEEEHFVAGFHQNMEKQRHKVWHDLHIKSNQFQVGGIVLMYDIKLFKHPGKLKTHWLGSYIVKEITNGGAMKLEKLNRREVRGLVNGNELKPYYDNCDLVA